MVPPLESIRNGLSDRSLPIHLTPFATRSNPPKWVSVDKNIFRWHSSSVALALQILRDPDTAAALLDPRRQAMLTHLQQAPNTASGLGRLLEMPRQKVNYHLHQLESAGLIEPVDTRRRGSTTERLVRATASRYLISPEALGALGPTPESCRDRFSATYLIALASRIITDLSTLILRSTRAGKRLATFSLDTEIRFRSADERARFTDELSNFLASQAARYHDASAPGGRPFRIAVAAWPRITKSESE